jgi:outer membrane lipoprotein-sorting protein
MAFLRQSLGLLLLFSLAQAAESTTPTTLTATEVIAKARAAVAKEPQYLQRVQGLHIEANVVDTDGKKLGLTILQLVAPSKRRQITYNPEHTSEEVIGSNGLEAWAKSTNIPKNLSKVAILSYEVVASMKDMAENDLGFYAAPSPNRGTVNCLGLVEVNGHKTYALEYSYKSGFKITRYFDAQNFLVVAADQLTSTGKIQRQQVEEIVWIEGLAFTKKETVFVDGKKFLDVTYDKIIINPEIAASSFAFPDR